MTQRFRFIAVLLAAAVFGGTAPGSAAEPPRVVASLKPIHSLVAGVMAGVGEPVLLVTGAASPHGYGLRPSAAGHLQDADLVFWVGPGLETFLTRTLAMAPPSSRVIALSEIDGLTLYATREGGIWEEHDHHDHAGDEADADEPDTHTHADSTDLHLWLDPENAVAMTRAIVAALSAADPDHADTYAANGENLEARLRTLDQDLERRLGLVRDRPFIVFHDAYQYFERHYGLAAAGAITVNAARAPGARRLQEIHQKLADTGAICVFSEPQFEPALVETVVAGTPARTGVLDPLGAALEPGPELYPALLDGVADSLIDCLGADRS